MDEREDPRRAGLTLAPAVRADLDALVALRNRLVSAAPWTAAELADDLFDTARKGGAATVVAWRAGEPRGFAGGVDLGAPAEFYASPMVAADRPVADALLDHVIAEARRVDAAWLRLSVYPGADQTCAALGPRGFRPALDFLTLVGDAAGCAGRATAPPSGWTRLDPGEDIDFDALAALDRRAFAGVANAPPVTADIIADDWSRRWPEASALWRAPDGDYGAFIVVSPTGAVDSVAVDPRHHRGGVARALLGHAAQVAVASERPRLEALIASDNAASLGLFRSLGFVEAARRTVYQLDFADQD